LPSSFDDTHTHTHTKESETLRSDGCNACVHTARFAYTHTLERERQRLTNAQQWYIDELVNIYNTAKRERTKREKERIVHS